MARISLFTRDLFTSHENDFNGTSGITFGNPDNLNFEGDIILQARIRINDEGDIAQGFHYVVAHNNNGDPEKEVFLRFRDGNYELGTWINQKNYQVHVAVPVEHIGIDLNIFGIYGNGQWTLYVNNRKMGTAASAYGALTITPGIWSIGKHANANDPQPEPRYFIGQINYVAIYGSAKILTDSDNNGYITSPAKNPDQAIAEEMMGASVPKPLTYFPSGAPADLTDVVKEIRYVKIVIENGGAPAGTTYNVQCTGNLKVFRTKWADYGGAIAPTDAIEAGDYYTHAVSADGSKKEDGFDKIRLYPAGVADPIGVIVFDVRQTPDQWLVPSGWKIEEEPSGSPPTFITMAPVNGAVPPKQEGSQFADDDNGRNGCTISRDTYNDTGFQLEIIYSFLRNTYDPVKNTGNDPTMPATGYLQPDLAPKNNQDEKIDKQDGRKVSFVGNSGIKLGSWKGAGAGVCEVQIIDLEKMVDLVGGRTAFEGCIDNAITIISPINTDTSVTFPSVPDSISYQKENLSQLMFGVLYGQKLTNIVGSAGKSFRELFHDNYTYFAGGIGKLKVTYVPLGTGANSGTLSVYRWDSAAAIYVLYYQAAEVQINGTISGKGTELDGHIYLQSHWGSGVTFSNLSISGV